MATAAAPGDHGVSDTETDEPVVELSVVWKGRRRCDDRTSDADNRKEADCNEQKQVTAMNTNHSASGIWQMGEKDLDVGGRYKIPKKGSEAHAWYDTICW